MSKIDHPGVLPDAERLTLGDPVFAEAFEYTEGAESVSLAWLLRTVRERDVLELSGYLNVAARGARLSGDLDRGARYSAEALRLARSADSELRELCVFDASWQQALLQGQRGRATSAEKTLATAVDRLSRDEVPARYRGSQSERLYAGSLMLSCLRFRQGKFSKAIEAANSALAVGVWGDDVRSSQQVVRERIVPELTRYADEHGDRRYRPSADEEYAFWLPALFQGEYGFSPEVPLSPEDREHYGRVLDLSRLPERAEVEAAYAVDTAGELMRRYFSTETRTNNRYEMWTKEYITALGLYIQQQLVETPGATVLEVGAGDGRLSEFLRRELGSSARVIAADNGLDHNQALFPVESVDYQEALKRWQPDLVITSWMPVDYDWTSQIRDTKSVRAYIMIGPPSHTGTKESWGVDVDSRYRTEGFERHPLPELNELKRFVHPWVADSKGFMTESETVAFSRQAG